MHEGKVNWSCLEDDKTVCMLFLVKKQFYIHHQTEVWFEIITMPGIKRS